jgi:hypothetical protein
MKRKILKWQKGTICLAAGRKVTLQGYRVLERKKRAEVVSSKVRFMVYFLSFFFDLLKP